MGSCCVESKILEIKSCSNPPRKVPPIYNNTSSNLQSSQSTAPNINNQINLIVQSQPPSDQVPTPNLQRKETEIIYSYQDFIKGELKGKGKHGEVYSGLCSLSGEIVAIKIIKNISEDKKRKILSSIQALYSLKHQNIFSAIKLSDPNTLDEKGDISLIYELCNGNSFTDLVSKFGIFEEKILQIYVQQILEGLQYLHSQNIIHKNLKGNNILVDGNGTIRISDALIDSIILGDGNEIYTNIISHPDEKEINYYIPPFFIQEKSKIIDQSFDLWYLGCVIIEISTGKNPWSHYTFQNQKEFIYFLSTTHLTPTIPKKLSQTCQEFVSLLFDREQTKKPDIYTKLFSHEFLQMEFKTNQNLNDTNITISQGLGSALQRGHVVNLLNSNDNPTFSITLTANENSSFINSICINASNFGNSNISKNPSSRIGDKIFKINLNQYNGEVYEEVAANLEQSPMLIRNSDSKDIYDFDPKKISLLSKKNI